MTILVYASKHFEIVVPPHPHVTRTDGGHLIINPKVAVLDRTKLDGEQTIELAKLTTVAGEAMATVLTQRGIEIGRINYQDNGNWRHELHVHLYGRARQGKLQPWGHFLVIPTIRDAFMKEMGSLEPLNADDIAALRVEIERLLATPKYRAF